MKRLHWIGRTAILMILVSFITALPALCQDKELTYQQAYLFGRPRLMGTLPLIVTWLDDDHYLEREGGPMGMFSTGGRVPLSTPIFKVHAESGERTLLLDYSAYNDHLPRDFRLAHSAGHTEDYTSFFFNRMNDLYHFSTETKRFKQLTATPGEENNPIFSPDGTKIAYTRDRDLYVVDIESGLEHQLTTDGSETTYNGWASWVYYEEILGRRSRYRAFWWSPDGKMIAFLWFDDSVTPKFPIYNADGTHGELEIQRYPKPGDPNPLVKLGIVHLDSKDIVWIDTDVKADHYIAWPFWTPDSKQLFFQWMNRGQDHLILYSADPETGKKKVVHEERQSAWVEWYTDLHFFGDGSGFLLRSDVDGWSHLYRYSMEGALMNRLTSGEWDVRNISLVDEENGFVYFHGFRKASTDNHLFRVALNGKRIKQLTETPGSHRCQVSPGGTYFIDTYSSIDMPPKMDLIRTGKDVVRNISDSKLDTMDDYALGTTELFTIPSGDGYDLPAVWTLPPDMDKTKHHPVIFAIYSGPGSMRVMNRWGSLASHFLAQHGIITISVDHRGSGHFGKKGVALMHRNLGKWEMQDLITAVKWLREQPFICRNRIGISGGSYGGYTTCMALTYGAGFFTHGIAASSVTDWRLYDTVYTERFMDTPAENPAGYDFGSVMTHAEKLEGILRITHGTLDDNVHMQNSIQLIDMLTDLNKPFEFMLYPNERHGIRPPKRFHSMRESVAFWLRHFFDEEFVIEEPAEE